MRNMLLKCLLFCLLLEVFTIVNAYAQQTKDQEIEQLKTENASLKKNLNEVYKENQALKIKNREWEYLFEVTTQELQLAIKKIYICHSLVPRKNVTRRGTYRKFKKRIRDYYG